MPRVWVLFKWKNTGELKHTVARGGCGTPSLRDGATHGGDCGGGIAIAIAIVPRALPAVPAALPRTAGSMLQIIVASAISLGLLVMHARCWPFVDHGKNLLKLGSEVVLMLVFLSTARGRPPAPRFCPAPSTSPRQR